VKSTIGKGEAKLEPCGGSVLGENPKVSSGPRFRETPERDKLTEKDRNKKNSERGGKERAFKRGEKEWAKGPKIKVLEKNNRNCPDRAAEERST